MKILISLLLLISVAAQAQHASYPMGGTATADTIVGGTSENSGTFAIWPSGDVSPKPRNQGFEIYFTAIGTNTTLGYMTAKLYVTDRANLAAGANGWMYVTEYNSWERFQQQANFAGTFGNDAELSSGEDWFIYADALENISCRYAYLELDATFGNAADSAQYIIYFVGDKGGH